MSSSALTPLQRVQHYVELCDFPVMIQRHLGCGTDGDVFETDQATAIKAFSHQRGYENERDTYLHLQRMGVTTRLGEFRLPEIQGFDDDLLIVEMDIMHDPPFVIDFAKVRLWRDPEFSDEVLRDREEQGRDLFGANWPRVLQLLADLESYQIYYLDPKPGNIVFGLGPSGARTGQSTD